MSGVCWIIIHSCLSNCFDGNKTDRFAESTTINRGRASSLLFPFAPFETAHRGFPLMSKDVRVVTLPLTICRSCDLNRDFIMERYLREDRCTPRTDDDQYSPVWATVSTHMFVLEKYARYCQPFALWRLAQKVAKENLLLRWMSHLTLQWIRIYRRAELI